MAQRKSNDTYEETMIEETMEQREEVMEDFSENDQAPIDEGSKKPKIKTGKAANAKNVRVRKSPSTTSSVLTLLAEGDQAEVLEKLPGWYKIRVLRTNEIGYVVSDLFKED